MNSVRFAGALIAVAMGAFVAVPRPATADDGSWKAQKEFRIYERKPGNKAFAGNGGRALAYAYDGSSVESAAKLALKVCEERRRQLPVLEQGSECRIVDQRAVPKP